MDHWLAAMLQHRGSSKSLSDLGAPASCAVQPELFEQSVTALPIWFTPQAVTPVLIEGSMISVGFVEPPIPLPGRWAPRVSLAVYRRVAWE